ncbi:MAG: hypothetical protein AMJ65_18345 [Phycisphaerae bacterium SG8_4]|nr:MAG: hypothetical protein AMJ65_18345 [Phycisphaerae bacterium SG8_4]
MRKKNPHAKPFKDFRRLISPQDLLSRAGTMMMRKSLKATIWTAGITSSGYLSGYLGLPGFSALQAIAAPFVVGGGMLGIGAGIKYIPRTLSKRLTAIAEANDLNLMEDYKKSQVMQHLNVLWDKVFWYESDIRYTSQQRADERDQITADRKHITDRICKLEPDVLERLGGQSEKDIDDIVMAVMTARPLNNGVEKSRQGFIISSLYALNHALPQSSQAKQIGFRLNLYEDVCDGGYFDESDVKLFEQYIGNTTLADIKSDVGFGKTEAVRQIARKMSWRFWFCLATRKVATGVGRAVKSLNDRYGTDQFNSQVLLWPGEEDAAWMQEFPGAREEVLRLRAMVVKGALGADYDNAVALLERTLLPCFEFATRLRARYDPEYCDGSLDYVCEDSGTNVKNNIVSDLKAYGYRQRDIHRAQAYATNAKNEISLFLDYLKAGGREDLFDDKLALRAAKIAFHIDKNGLKKLFQESGPAASRAEINTEIDKVIAQKQVYSTRLTGLRLHHQLTMLQIAGYKDLAKQLAYSD